MTPHGAPTSVSEGLTYGLKDAAGVVTETAHAFQDGSTMGYLVWFILAAGLPLAAAYGIAYLTIEWAYPTKKKNTKKNRR